MAEGNGDSSEAEVHIAGNKFKAKSKFLAEIISVMLLTLLGVVAYGGFLHLQDSREANQKTVQTLEKISERTEVQSQKTISAIREQTCLSSLPESERKADFASPHGWCKRITQ